MKLGVGRSLILAVACVSPMLLGGSCQKPTPTSLTDSQHECVLSVPGLSPSAAATSCHVDPKLIPLVASAQADAGVPAPPPPPTTTALVPVPDAPGI